MPLILSLRRGQDFYLNDTQVVMKRVADEKPWFEIEVAGQRYEVDDQCAVEIKGFPDVFVTAGDRPQPGVQKVVIDAPRTVMILRGDRYRGGLNANGKPPDPRPPPDTFERVHPGKRFVEPTMRRFS